MPGIEYKVQKNGGDKSQKSYPIPLPLHLMMIMLQMTPSSLFSEK